MCILAGMPRVTIDVPAELYAQMKARQIDPSELFVRELRMEIRRHELCDETDRYLAELREEVGEPTAEERAAAKGLAREIRKHIDEAAETHALAGT